jgi:hypothetical protein
MRVLTTAKRRERKVPTQVPTLRGGFLGSRVLATILDAHDYRREHGGGLYTCECS